METSVRRQARGIKPDGEIEWQDDADPNQEVLFGMTKDEHDFARRNAANPNGLLEMKAYLRSQTVVRRP
jgi:hypothetical protein